VTLDIDDSVYVVHRAASACLGQRFAFESRQTRRVPRMRPEDHAHMLEGLRKAGWPET
jgi:hypothetical protein